MFGLGIIELMALMFVFAVYFVPFFIAASNNHPQKLAIFALNLLTGWTFFGWGGALVWACIK
jgi:hypothetical protein